VAEDRALSTGLSELRQDGGSVGLHELTGGDRDPEYMPHQPVSRDTLENEGGGQIDMEETFTQRVDILVFLGDGEIARATYMTPDLLQPGKYSSNVRITAEGYPARLQVPE
jgi:hypothetical protein